MWWPFFVLSWILSFLYRTWLGLGTVRYYYHGRPGILHLVFPSPLVSTDLRGEGVWLKRLWWWEPEDPDLRLVVEYAGMVWLEVARIFQFINASMIERADKGHVEFVRVSLFFVGFREDADESWYCSITRDNNDFSAALASERSLINAPLCWYKRCVQKTWMREALPVFSKPLHSHP